MVTQFHNQKFAGFPFVPHALPLAGIGGGSLLRRAGAAFADWRARRRSLRELAALSDRDLADIGLSRLELARVFDKDFAAKR